MQRYTDLSGREIKNIFINILPLGIYILWLFAIPMEGTLLPRYANFLFFVFSNSISFFIIYLIRHTPIETTLERISSLPLLLLSLSLPVANTAYKVNSLLVFMGIFASFAMVVAFKRIKSLGSPRLGIILSMVLGNIMLSIFEMLPLTDTLKLLTLVSALVLFFLITKNTRKGTTKKESPRGCSYIRQAYLFSICFPGGCTE